MIPWRLRKRPFDIGDEVCLKGTVRLLDVGGPGSVTVEITRDRHGPAHHRERDLGRHRTDRQGAEGRKAMSWQKRNETREGFCAASSCTGRGRGLEQAYRDFREWIAKD